MSLDEEFAWWTRRTYEIESDLLRIVDRDGARLALTLEQLDKGAAEIKRLQAEHEDYVVRATAEVTRLRAELAAERERCAHWKQEADNLIVALRRGVGAAIRKGEP